MSADATCSPATREGGAEADATKPLPFSVVGIGASVGGLEAMTELLQAIPEGAGMALAVAIHLAPERPSSLVEVLARAAPMPVREAQDGLPVEQNHVYVIAPGTEVSVSRGVLRVRPRERLRFRPVNTLLSSLAYEQRSDAIGVVLSGAADDGADGLREIKQVGGITFAQDDTAKVQGMPQNSIATGAVDFVLPPAAIAAELARLAKLPRVVDVSGSPEFVAPKEAQLQEEEYLEILRQLRDVTGVDFREYKRNTVRRRIVRRIALHRIERVAEFIELLRDNPAELHSLRDDILINVTQFFRDPNAFVALQQGVVAKLIDRAACSPRTPIRIWVPGCATGEEAYSIAICVLEGLRETKPPVRLQIFGTDMSEGAIEKARAGVYAADTAFDVSAQRLEKYFIKVDSGFQVTKALRDVCVFAKHDMARDPPFSCLDLISCRNVLIYMSTPLQRTVIPLFHYGLNPEGHLFLGPAESIGSLTDLFTAVDRRANLYVKNEANVRVRLLPQSFARGIVPAANFKRAASTNPPQIDIQREADLLLSQNYAPPAVIVNEDLEVLHFRGRTGSFLEPAPGKACYNLLAMSREGLRSGIANAVRSALQANAPAAARGRSEPEGNDVEIRAVPLGAEASPGGRCVLVLFDDGSPPKAMAAPMLLESEFTPESAVLTLARARQETEAMRLQLQSVIDGYQATHEELRSANEEVLSSNEELQSTNEELRTAKEELQSSNEELSTINDELQARILELGRANDDLSNVLDSVQIPIVILTQDLLIRSFTPAAGPLLNLIPSDVGRPLSNINVGISLPELTTILDEVLRTQRVVVREMQDHAGRWHTLGVRPYRTRANTIDGLIMILIDVTETKRATDEIAAARDYAESIVTTVNISLLVLDAALRIISANAAFYRFFLTSREESEGRLLQDIGGEWNLPELLGMLRQVISENRGFDDYEAELSFPRIGTKTVLFAARRIETKASERQRILLVIEDVTDRRRHELASRERDRLVIADARKNEFLAILAHELRNPLTPIVHAAAILRQGALKDQGLQRAVEVIARQSAHMGRLLEDLLDVSRIAHGQVELRKCYIDLRDAIRSAVDSARTRLEAQRQEIRLSLPPRPVGVVADATRVEQVIGNLINNANKYGGYGGRIDLSLAVDGDWAVARIRDNGIGMAADTLPRVFDLFAQADRGLDREGGGLGIGLTVVQRLVQMHGGTVSAHSDGAGKGSEFVVRLPAIPTAVRSAPDRIAPSGAAPDAGRTGPRVRRRILVVEDNQDAAEMLRAVLELWGHDVRTVRDGAAALEAARVLAPDLALVDIGLPGMNGYEIARELRRLPRLKRTRLVAMTGYGQKEDRRKSREAGFDLHMVKPASVSDLEALFEPSRARTEVPGGRMKPGRVAPKRTRKAK